MESALGTNAVSDLGQKLGVDTEVRLPVYWREQLPKIIDALSPQGEVSPQANNDLLSAGMELLKGNSSAKQMGSTQCALHPLFLGCCTDF